MDGDAGSDVAFVSAAMFLIRASYRWDHRLEAALGVSVLFCLMLCIQGAIWAKPTWGVWWDWDPRLTTTAVLLMAFTGIVALRHFIEDPGERFARRSGGAEKNAPFVEFRRFARHTSA
jgi:heme exporter protein C